MQGSERLVPRRGREQRRELGWRQGARRQEQARAESAALVGQKLDYVVRRAQLGDALLALHHRDLAVRARERVERLRAGHWLELGCPQGMEVGRVDQVGNCARVELV